MDNSHPGNPHNYIQSTLTKVLSSIDAVGNQIGNANPTLPGSDPKTNTNDLMGNLGQLMERQIKEKMGATSTQVHDQLIGEMRPQLEESRRLHEHQWLKEYTPKVVKFDKDGFMDLGGIDPTLAGAMDVSGECTLIEPSPPDAEYISPWESILTTCKVIDLHQGFVVVKVLAETFENLDPDVDSVMFAVTQTPHHDLWKFSAEVRKRMEDRPFHVVVKNSSNIFVPGLLTDPEQVVYVVNEFGLESVPPEIEELIWPINLSAPGLWERQQAEGLLTAHQQVDRLLENDHFVNDARLEEAAMINDGGSHGNKVPKLSQLLK